MTQDVFPNDPEPTPARVVVLGLGTIGLPVAQALVAAGYSVYGLDRSADRRQMAAQQGVLIADRIGGPEGPGMDILVCSLPGPAEVVAALLEPSGGPLSGLVPGGLVVDLTTNSPRVGRRLAARCQEMGLRFVDAPVSELPPSMVVMAGADGSDGVAAELLAKIARHVIYLGSPLAGYTAKLLHQYMFLSSLLAGAESLRAARALGVSGEHLLTIAAEGSAYSKALTLFPGIEAAGLSRRPSAPLQLIHKDVSLIEELDAESGLGLTGVGRLREALRSAISELGADAPLHRLMDVLAGPGPAAVPPGSGARPTT